MQYKLTAKPIIAYAARCEREGLAFVMTAGHGNDPFFMQLSTIEGILLAAPTACKGFIFPEVARDETPAFRYAVLSHIKPVCDLCLKHGNRKVFLRAKFLFWAADCYSDMWSWMLADKKYKDVIVPDYAKQDEIPGVEKLLITDGEVWYDEQGGRHSAADYARCVEETLRAASNQLFARIRGDVAWTATRIDPSHVRLVLIDSGYLDPADRVAEVTVNADVVAAVDILRGERLDVHNNHFTAAVPMGTLRVIDIEHR